MADDEFEWRPRPTKGKSGIALGGLILAASVPQAEHSVGSCRSRRSSSPSSATVYRSQRCAVFSCRTHQCRGGAQRDPRRSSISGTSVQNHPAGRRDQPGHRESRGS